MSHESHQLKAPSTKTTSAQPLRGILKKSPQPTPALTTPTQLSDNRPQRPYRWVGYKGKEDLAARICTPKQRQEGEHLDDTDAVKEVAEATAPRTISKGKQKLSIDDDAAQVYTVRHDRSFSTAPPRLCPIDNQPFVQPVTISCCANVYCRKCIFDMLARCDAKCLNCGRHVVPDDVIDVEDELRDSQHVFASNIGSEQVSSATSDSPNFSTFACPIQYANLPAAERSVEAEEG